MACGQPNREAQIPTAANTATSPSPATPIQATATLPPTPIPTSTSSPTPLPIPSATVTPELTIPPSPTVTTSPITQTIHHGNISFVLDSRLADEVYLDESAEFVQFSRFLFAPDGLCPEVGCLTVYDVASFRTNIPGGEAILDELSMQLAAGSATYVPTWGAAILLQAKNKWLPFPSGPGLRALVMRGQNGFWANNEALVYDFHGLTADGRYYINITIPIDAPILMDSYDPSQNRNGNALPTSTPSPDDDIDAQMRLYNAVAAQHLNALSDDDFTPSLIVLDSLVASLVVGEP